MNKYITGTIAGALIAVAALTGCKSSSAPAASHSQAKATVSALASVPGADAKQVLIHAGVPINGTSAQQITFVKSFLASKTFRDALYVKLGIPPQNKSAFQSKLLDAAKADHVLTSHTGRVKFFDVDFGNIYAQEA